MLLLRYTVTCHYPDPGDFDARRFFSHARWSAQDLGLVLARARRGAVKARTQAGNQLHTRDEGIRQAPREHQLMTENRRRALAGDPIASTRMPCAARAALA